MVDASSFDEPSTKQAAQTLDKWGAATPTLVALAPDEAAAAKSFRNIERVTVLEADSVGVADVVGAASVILSESALEALSRRALGEPSEDMAAGKDSEDA